MKGVKHRAGNDPRAAALLVLNEVLSSTQDSQAVLDRQLTGSSLVPGDKALCTELVYGVLRRHLRLNWFLRTMLDKPDKLPTEMLLVLELAAYEIAFTRIPSHASVNWAVGFIRNRFGQGLSKVGNGVLRSFERKLGEEFNNPLYYLKRLGIKLEKGALQSGVQQGQVSNDKLTGNLPVDGENTTGSNGGSAAGGLAGDHEAASGVAATSEAGGEAGVAIGIKNSVLSYSADPRFLAAYYGMPEWIVNLWLAAYGPEATESYLKASALPAPMGVRLNPCAPGYKSLLNEMLQEEDAVLVPPAAVALPGGARRPVKFMQREGKLSRQSAASYQALWQLDPASWQQPVWDACAGRGGKSLALLEQGIAVALLSDSSKARLSGFEPDFERLFPKAGQAEGVANGKAERIAENAAESLVDDATAASIPSNEVSVPAGPAGPASSAGSSPAASGKLPAMPELYFGPAEQVAGEKEFATIILDVPCSGLGTLSHRPEIRWRRDPSDLERLCASQGSLLENALRSLKRGGRIVYLTCTINPSENENRVNDFLESHPDFKIEKSWQTPADSNLNEFFWGAVLKRDEK
ncbi:hypothetical protein LJC48_06075 [Desulfovibrio sp. OttesenSCG-928-C06]|nr:hypothetical protein [Desulfovibrio sp. OttesenSCG-928-C06]